MLSVYLQLLDDDRDRFLFAQLYEQNKERMLWLAKTYVTADDLAEDVVHDAFLSVAKNFQKISGKSCQEQGAYLVKTVRTKSIDLLRREKKYRKMEPWCDDYGGAFDNVRAEEALREQGDDVRRAVEIILGLPAIYRDVLERRLIREKSNKEAAEELGISEDTCAQRYRRGREMVMKKLSEEGIHT